MMHAILTFIHRRRDARARIAETERCQTLIFARMRRTSSV